MKRKKICIAVSNDLVTDHRVHKVAQSLHQAVGEVLLIGRQFKTSMPLHREYSSKRLRLLFHKKVFFYAEFNLRLFFFLLFQKADVIVANDLDTLLACFLAAKLKGAALVYDSHEYFTEVPELHQRPRVQRIWLAIEKALLPRLKNAYTVCPSIADIYREKYNIEMQVVRNVPPLHREEHRPGPLKDPKIIIYQGAINVGRGIEEAIRAMNYVEGAQLWIYGSGDIEAEISDLIAQEGLSQKVVLKGRVPLEELHSETRKASLGLCIEKGKEMGLSYYYALPNKLFDYIQAGVPVLLNDLPEKRRIQEAYGIGYILESYEPELLGQQMMHILQEASPIIAQNLKVAARSLCWEKEEETLLQIYHHLS